MSQQTLINGNRYSFTNIDVIASNYVVGAAVVGLGNQLPRGVFKSINYDGGQEPGIVQGNQITPLGRTDGYGTANGSFEMYASELDDFFVDMTNNGQFPICTVSFSIVIAYSVNDIDVRTDTLSGVRITKVSSPNQQGSDATSKSCDLSIMRINLNGIDLYADPSA